MLENIHDKCFTLINSGVYKRALKSSRGGVKPDRAAATAERKEPPSSTLSIEPPDGDSKTVVSLPIRIQEPPSTISANASATESLSVDIGDTNRLVEPYPSIPNNVHEWSFFVYPSRTDIIQAVEVRLLSYNLEKDIGKQY